MTKLILLIAITVSAFSAQAGLLEAKIQSGPNQGAGLYEVVSRKVPARALNEAFSFFDRYNGMKRSALVYSLTPKPGNSKLSIYDCDSTGVICKTEFIRQELFANKQFLVVFDLNQTSMLPRLHIVNLQSGEVTSLYASHGKESSCANDPTRACKFISHRDSEASPLGFFITGHTYFGEVGWTIPLNGIQGEAPGVLRNDVPTTIVIHGATYASPEFRRSRGFMGRSHGCPAISYNDLDAWKDRLQDGALFYFHHDSLPRELAPVSYLLSN